MEKLKRHAEADRPEIVLDSDPRRYLSLPEQMGFENENGAILQMSPEHARRLGLITEEEFGNRPYCDKPEHLERSIANHPAHLEFKKKLQRKDMTRKEWKHLKKKRLGY